MDQYKCPSIKVATHEFVAARQKSYASFAFIGCG
jgi:hypothetical protein